MRASCATLSHSQFSGDDTAHRGIMLIYSSIQPGAKLGVRAFELNNMNDIVYIVIHPTCHILKNNNY